MPHTFTDSRGHAWSVAITYDSIQRVKTLLPGVNLAQLLDGEPPLLTRLQTDLELLCNTAFALIKPQADQLGVTDVQFGEALGGEAILAADQALWGALMDFFQSLRRQEVVAAIAKQRAVVTAGIRAAAAKLETLDEQLMANRIEAIDLNALVGASTSGSSAGDSPALSVSTPAPGP